MKTLLKNCLFSALVFVLGFVLIEGTSSGIIIAHKVWISLRTHHPSYIRYDRELGWVSIPNYYDKDCFAPGVYLRTNSRGFRGNQETADPIPPGKVRLICSGDSFTLGDGVDNDHTWCQRLASMNNSLETVNMGESGYGLDQMYLGYRRDGMSFGDDIHVLAVIGDDFRRMDCSDMVGCQNKPVLRLRNESLVVTNVPVPREPRLARWWRWNGRSLRELRTVQLSEAGLSRITPRKPPTGPTTALCQTISKVIDELRSLNSEKNRVFVLAYLPTQEDYYGTDPSFAFWRAFLRQETARTGLPLIDLTEDFQKLSPQEVRRLFIQPNPSRPTFGAGHYSDEGNEFVARELYSDLLSRPEIQGKFAERRQIAATFGSH